MTGTGPRDDTVASAGSPAHFDVCGPLPTGTTVLEASAGTGKTFTIAALATRYVAEGLAELHELMLVTFGRAATQELRERVRERLVDTERRLADPAVARASTDALLAHLASAPDAEVCVRRKRLATALADFDAATIATTHGFCQQMLTGLGIAADMDAGAAFVESNDDLVVEVVQDLYLRKYGRPDSPAPMLTYADALDSGRAAVQDPQARLAPDTADPASPAGLRVGISRSVRAEVEARKRRRRLVDYDDLISRLHAALADPHGGAAAQQRVRTRFRVVMVDEFQDTDPLQWQILRLAFHGHTTLVLIGDPKQAIYAFRGGDVVTYLRAAADASTRASLGTCWRSDGDLLSSLQQVFGQAALGHRDIAVRPVRAAHPDRRLLGGLDAPLRLRVVGREQAGGDAAKLPRVGPVRALIAQDLAGDIVGLLNGPARLSIDGGSRPVAPGDIAVLVHRHAMAVLVRDALAAAGVPAVLSGAVNVFSTAMAREWLRLLQALEQPHHTRRVRTAALGCFVGWDPARLSGAGEAAIDSAMDQLRPLLRGWSELLARGGVPALLETVTELGLPSRLLRTDDGERELTDLRHLAQALHSVAVTEQLGTAALVEWLQRRIADADADQSEERSRRLESDADAVQVVTVHRSKGLQFPIVYVPSGWDRYKDSKLAILRLHDQNGARVLDVGGTHGPDRAISKAAHDAEESGEDLRLLYVAMTRAQCQVVTWWAPATTTATSPLHRLLFGGHPPGAEPPATVAVPSNEGVGQAFAELAARSGGCIAVESVSGGPAPPWQPPAGAPADLAAARFDRDLDLAWRRTSYTALTSAAYEAAHGAAHGAAPGAAPGTAHGAGAVPAVGSEPEARVLDDEAATAVLVAPAGAADADRTPAEAALRGTVSPMSDLPAGTGFGIVVHSLLEQVDTSAPDLAVELVQRSREVLTRRPTGSLDADTLAVGLLPAMQTPLGPLVDGARLCDVQRADRLTELDFELPLAGGDTPTRSAGTVRALARLLRDRLPAGDALAGYPDQLDLLDDQRLRGYLVGSLDLVLRVPTSDGDARYVVADYKTNWLGEGYPGSGEQLTAWHYRPAALADAMVSAHYPLQALLYLVALHRYLRWRQPGYDPDRHLMGALYLFIRGMCGADTPMVDGIPCGVFGWRPPPGLVAELSDLLAGRSA